MKADIELAKSYKIYCQRCRYGSMQASWEWFLLGVTFLVDQNRVVTKLYIK